MALVTKATGLGLGEIINMGRNNALGGGQWIRDPNGTWRYIWTATADGVNFNASTFDAPVFLFGREGADTFVGSRFADYIDAGAGNDHILGSGGRDTVFGGEGNDRIDYSNNSTWGTSLNGGNGNDTIQGGAAGENLIGGAGDDLLIGGGGTDYYDAGDGNDWIDTTFGGRVTVAAGAGNDSVWLSARESAYVVAGSGDDHIFVNGKASSTIFGGSGNDIIADWYTESNGGYIYAEGGNDSISFAGTNAFVLVDGGDGNDTIVSGFGSDMLNGGAGDDSVNGGKGDDQFYWLVGAGSDTYVGGGGTDWLNIEFSDWAQYAANYGQVFNLIRNMVLTPSTRLASGTFLNLAYQDFSVAQVSVSGTVVALASVGIRSDGSGPPVSGIVLTPPSQAPGGSPQPGSDPGHTDPNGDPWSGAPPANDDLVIAQDASATDVGMGQTFDGGAGNDTLVSLDRADVLIGGEGSDLLLGGGNADTLDGGGGSGSDTLEGGAGDDSLILRGAGTASGGAGKDIIQSFGAAATSLDGGAGNDTMLAWEGGEATIMGGAGEDSVEGSKGADFINGGDGNDTLEGGNGNDTISGGRGADRLHGNFGDDTFLFGGDGAFAAGQYWRYSTPGNRIYSVDLNAGGYQRSDDTIMGGYGNDLLLGTDNRDGIFAVDQNSFLRLKDVEFINAGDGDDVIDLEYTTDKSVRQIMGGGGRDIIVGSTADEIIVGGTGADTMAGGSGQDTFVFSAKGGNGNDVILDFRAGDQLKFMSDGNSILEGRDGNRYLSNDFISAMSNVKGFANSVVAVGSDSVLVLNNREQITFVGVSRTDLTSWLGL